MHVVTIGNRIRPG